MPALIARFVAALICATTGILSLPVYAADDWQDMVFISSTVGNSTNRLCMGVPDDKRPSDIGCPSYAPSLSTAGHVSITGNVSANKFIGDGSGLTNLNVQGDRIVSDTHALFVNQYTGYVSLTTGGSTWGYFSAGWNYLSNLFANTVSSSLVSATNVSATYVDATRSGTVSATYGHFRYISGTDIYGRFTGDGSGLSGVIAGSSDRLVSGSTGGTRMVAISSTGYISITQAGANSGWFDPYRGLVTLGVSATGGISGTTGYFAGPVGIGTIAPGSLLEVSGSGTSTRIRVNRSGVVWELAPMMGGGFALVDNSNNADLVRIAVSATGNVAIGQSINSAHAKLNVGGTISASDAIQIGTSSLTCGSGIAGALRYASGNIQFCNGTAWANLVGAADVMGDRIVSGTTNAIGWQDRSLTITTNNVQQMIVGENGNVGIGTSTPEAGLHVSYSAVWFGGTGTSSMRLGRNRVGNQYSHIDLIGDDTYPAYGLRIIRNNGGANTESMLQHRGTGALQLHAYEAAPVVFATDNIERARITPGGNVGVGVVTPTATLQVSGSLIVSTTGQSTSPSLFIGTNGQVGMGTSAPITGMRLTVNGSGAFVRSGGNDAGMYMTASNGAHGTVQAVNADNTLTRNLILQEFGGRVGLGKTAPLAALDVVGTISASDAIQLAQNTIACGTQVSGSIRYNTTSNTVQFCNGTGWVSLASGTTGGGTLAGTGSATAVAFWGGPSALTYSSGFYWDNSNKRLGIGTNTPTNNLHVAGSAPFVGMTISNSLAGTTNSTFLTLDRGDVANGYASLLFGTAGSANWTLNVPAGGTDLRLWNDAQARELVRFASGGRVGVGMPSPTATLQVSGSFTVSTTGQNTSPSLYVSTDGRIGIGTSDPTMGVTVHSKVLVNTEGLATGLAVYSSNVSKSFALNPLSNGAWILYDGHLNNWNVGLTQKGGNVALGGNAYITSAPIPSSLTIVGEVQVASSGMACVSANNAGAIRYSGGTLYYCNASNTWAALGTSAGVTGTGSATAVAFWSGSNALTYSSGFYWDNGNKRLGVGTNTPEYDLDVRGTGIINASGTLAGLHIWDRTGAVATSAFFRTGGITRIWDSTSGDRLAINNTTGNVGVATLSPTSTLQVSGTFTVSTSAQNATPSLHVDMGGRVGIGTSTPRAPLHMKANASGILLEETYGGADNEAYLVNYSNQFAIQRRNANADYLETPYVFDVRAPYSTIFADSTGNVGVSNNLPLAKLDVRGTISASDAIQVGSSSLACGGAIAGAIRYNSPNLQFCNGTSWTNVGGGGGGTVTGAGSATAVAYWNGANALTYDTDGFYWDATNNRLGIGTNTPSVTLNVVANQSGAAAIRSMNLNSQGYGGITFGSNTNETVGMVTYSNAGAFAFPNSVWIGTRSNTVPLVFTANAADVEDMRLSNGRLGIGTPSATATLQVSGTFTVSLSTQTTTPSLYVTSRVGIQTSNPQEMAHIGNEGVGGRLFIGEDNATRRGLLIAATVANEVSGSTYPPFVRMTAFSYGASKSLPLVINPHGSEGFVSIGKFDPKAMLDVQGTISASNAIQVGQSSLLCGSTISGSIRYNTTSDTLQVCTGSGWKSLVSGTTGSGGGTITGGGSATAIAFWSGTSALSYDSGLYWDNVNKRLGIGTTTPLRRLEVAQASDDVLSGFGVANAASNSRVSLWVKGNIGHLWSGGTGQTPLVLNAGGGLVGIGTESPTAALQVSGSLIVSTSSQNITPSLFVGTNGKVGVGTSAPSGRMEIVQDAGGENVLTLTQGSDGVNAARFELRKSRGTPTAPTAVQANDLIGNIIAGGYDGAEFNSYGGAQISFFAEKNFDASNRDTSIRFQTAQGATVTEKMRIMPNGNVGIGTLQPSATLTVSGTISASDAIQLGQNTIACATGVSGSIRYNTTSNTVQFCNGTGWVSLASGTTGGGGGATADGDRITSGTLAMIANSATSYVSLSTAGTTWGYLNSGNSFLPVLTANRVSATNISATLLQLGQSAATCSIGISGSIRYSIVSSTVEMCNGTAWTSLGRGGVGYIDSFVSDGTSFSTTSACETYVDIPNSSKSVTIPAAGTVLMNWNASLYVSSAGTVFKVRGCIGGVCGGASRMFNNEAASHRTIGGHHTLNVAAGTYTGKLQVCRAQGSGNIHTDSGDYLTWAISIPGGEGGSGGGPTALSGLSDVDVTGVATGKTLAYNGSQWVVSDSVSPGVAALASLTDVTLTNLAGRDYLRYDSVSGKWVNISESIVMSTTTSVPGWPDAIMCNVTNPNHGTLIFPLTHAPYSNGNFYYGFNNGSMYQVVFSSSGAFSSYSNMTTTNCNKSIAQLYADGQAFNFIGGNGAGGGALSDRITSGTVSVTVNTNGFVSLTTGVTDWGYLSSGASYLPNLRSDHVSSSNVSATYLQLSSPTTVLACNSGLTGAMRYTSGTMQVCDGSNWGNIGIGVPTGTIAAFAASSCPSGWTEYTAARGRFLRGIDNGAGFDPDGTRAPGTAQEDAFQGHRIRVYDFNAAQPRGGGGSVNVWNVNSGAYIESDGNFYSDGANGTPRTANETRSKNVAVTFCVYSGFQSAPGQTILTTLASLTDVSVAGVQTGQVLAFDGASWVASNTSSGGGSALGDRITSGTLVMAACSPSGPTGHFELIA